MIKFDWVLSPSSLWLVDEIRKPFWADLSWEEKEECIFEEYYIAHSIERMYYLLLIYDAGKCTEIYLYSRYRIHSFPQIAQINFQFAPMKTSTLHIEVEIFTKDQTRPNHNVSLQKHSTTNNVSDNIITSTFIIEREELWRNPDPVLPYSVAVVRESLFR